MSDPSTLPAASAKKALPSIIAALLLVAVLLLYMFTFIVQWNEAAILTTFERAETSGVITQPGLHFKWFWPVQTVYQYDLRWRYLEYLLADQTITADRKNVIVSISAVWKIDHPLTFFQRFKTVAAGETRVKNILRARVNDVVGRYNLSDFVNTDPAALKLPEIEAQIQKLVDQDLAGANPNDPGLGVSISGVGFKRLGLPKAVTESVFKSMKEELNLLAENYRQQGKAKAEEIKSKADQQSREILSFAGRLAATERSAGLAAAGKYAGVFQQDPDFAAFLRRLDVLKQTLNKNTVFLLDGRSFGGTFSLLMEAPTGRTGILPVPSDQIGILPVPSSSPNVSTVPNQKLNETGKMPVPPQQDFPEGHP